MKSLRLLAALAATCTSVFALTITPTSGLLNSTRWEGLQTSQAQIDTAVAAIMGASATLVYKNDAPGSETGPLTSSYNTTFTPPGDPLDALVQYVSGSVASPTVYGLVKDGNQEPAWYLFNLTALGWNGTADLLFDDFWPGQGAISHVALYSAAPSVPDGGASIVLLGFALLCVHVIRRRLMG